MRYIKVTRSDAEPGELPVIRVIGDNVSISGQTITVEDITREEAEASIDDKTVETDTTIQEGIDQTNSALNKVTSFGQDVRQQTVFGADYITISLWVMKAIRAERYLAGNATERDLQLLQLEATTRGRNESVDDLAKKIDANSIHLQTAGVMTEALERSAGDIIKLTDPDKLDVTMNAIMQKASVALKEVSAGSQLEESEEIKEDLGNLIDKVEDKE